MNNIHDKIISDKFHEETLKYYMDNFDFNNVEIDEALR